MKKVLVCNINLNLNWRIANINTMPFIAINPQGHGVVATNIVRIQKRCIN